MQYISSFIYVDITKLPFALSIISTPRYMKNFISSLFASAALASPVINQDAQWTFTLKGDSGIVALESIVVSPTLVVFFDLASDDPLQINNHSAWGALWNLETSEVTPLDLITSSFCGSGARLSNGTMVCVFCYLLFYSASHITIIGQCWRRPWWLPRQPRHT